MRTTLRRSSALIGLIVFTAGCPDKKAASPVNGGNASSFNDLPVANCGSIPSGGSQSRIRFQNASVPSGSTCVKETQLQTCSSGNLSAWSGSYVESDCAPLTLPASAPTWTTGNVTASTSIAVQWTLPSDTSRIGTFLHVYRGADCTGLPWQKLTAAPSGSSLSFPVGDAEVGLFSSRVETRNRLGAPQLSPCSLPLRRALPLPSPSNPAWTQASPYPGTTVQAAWPAVPNASGYVVRFFASNSCQGTALETRTLAAAATSATLTGTLGQYYTYTVATRNTYAQDSAPACSSAMRLYVTNPEAASNLRWSPSGPVSTAAVTAQWTASTSPGLVSQKLQLYVGANCATATGTPLSLATTAASAGVSATLEAVNSFRIKSAFSDQRVIDSPCSPSLSAYLPAPTATAQSWSITASATESTKVALTWKLPGDAGVPVAVGTGFVNVQSATLFRTANCVANGNEQEETLSNVTRTATFNVWPSTTYSARIKTWNAAGQFSLGACMSSIVVTPAPVTGLTWSKPNYRDEYPVAQWTVPAMINASLTLTVHRDATCADAPLQTFSSTYLSQNNPPTLALTALPSGTYRFAMIADYFGVKSTKACSAATSVQAAPPAPSNLRWDAASSTWGVYQDAGPFGRASWTPSAGSEVSRHTLQLYDGRNCANAHGSAVEVGQNTAYDFRGKFNYEYTYTVTAWSTNGLKKVSECSPPLALVFQRPTEVLWLNQDPLPELVGLIPRLSPFHLEGLQQAVLKVYEDLQCSGTPVQTLNFAPDSARFTPQDRRSYRFVVEMSYGDGFVYTTPCSTSIDVDTHADTKNTDLSALNLILNL